MKYQTFRTLWRPGAGIARQLIVLTLSSALLSCKAAEVERARAESPNPSHESAMVAAMADSNNWASYGRDRTNQRYSPLKQITRENVAHLKLAWRYKTGIPQAFETSPVVIDGVMYFSTPLNHIVALDAESGKKLWEHAESLSTTVFCCGPVNRGVAVYGGRVYSGTLDGRLIALEAKTGKPVFSVQVGENEQGYAIDAAPVAVDGKIIVGISGAEYGIRGFISAYDAESGKLIWRFYTIPSPEEGGWWGKWSANDPFGTPLNRNIAAEKADSARYSDAWKTGGASVWQAPAIDSALGLVIFTVGNPSPDLNGSIRPGDNLYTNSIVAVHLQSGKLAWYFQELPHDVWDLDAAAPVILFDLPGDNGKLIPAVAQPGKTGWVYVLDRATGKPLRRTEPFVPQENIFAQPTREGVRMLPGANGGSEWSAAAFSPKTGFMYVLGLHQPMLYKVKPEELKPPAMWLSGAFYGNGEPQYGLFSAVNLTTGKIAWQVKLPDPMIGGALSTAGDLVFTGTKDKRLIAFDAESGKQLWEYQANAGVNAPPVSYGVHGKQFIAVAAGGNYQINSPRGDEVLAFVVDTAAIRPAPAP